MKQCPPEGRCAEHYLGNAEAGFTCGGQERAWPADPAPRDAIWRQVCQEVRQQFVQGSENGFETWTRPLLAWQGPEPARLKRWQSPPWPPRCRLGPGAAKSTTCWFPSAWEEPSGCFQPLRERVLWAGCAGLSPGWSARVPRPSPERPWEPRLPTLPVRAGAASSPAWAGLMKGNGWK